MRGFPVTRATSPNGRWAYTLYDGAEHPFIHALDTVGREAACIDLDGLAGRSDLYDLRLDVSQGGGTLAVVAGSEAVALVDTQSFRVSDPPEPGEPTSSEPAEERGEFVAWLSSVRPAPSSRSAGWS